IPTDTEPAEKVAEHAEDVIHAHVREIVPGRAGQAGMTVTVVALLSVRIAEYFVGLGGFLEFDLSLRILTVAIRVVLHGGLAVGALDFVRRGFAGHAENVVIVALSSHLGTHLPFSRCYDGQGFASFCCHPPRRPAGARRTWGRSLASSTKSEARGQNGCAP